MALDLIEELEAIVEALEQAGVEYAVCGGLALAIHGHPRMTKDIDLLVQSGDVQRAFEVAKGLGFDVPARRMIFRAGKPDQHEMQSVSKLDPITSDLLPLDLIVVVPVLVEVWAGRLRAPWGDDRTITVVSPSGLATMKRLAGRPQDLVDIAKLEGTADDPET